MYFSDNSVVGGEMWAKFKPIQTCIVVLVTFKNEKDPEYEGARVVTTFLPLKVYGDLYQTLKGS